MNFARLTEIADYLRARLRKPERYASAIGRPTGIHTVKATT
jgi:hypothetical protein